MVYPSLTLHALTPTTPDLAAHVYCQVDESDNKALGSGLHVNGNGNGVEEEEEDEGGDEYTPMREVRLFVSEDKREPPCTCISPLIPAWRVFDRADDV